MVLFTYNPYRLYVTKTPPGYDTIHLVRSAKPWD
jgi:hypothetical protein